MIFKNGKVYDILKWVSLTGCYALWYLWTELAEVWALPYAVQIGKTIAIVGCAIGILIGVSGIKYKWQNSIEPVELIEEDTESEG